MSRLDHLVLAAPAAMPAEPPAGAFTLAAALAGHGRDAALLDLSLAFYHRVLGASADPAVGRAVAGLLRAPGGYDPHRHRTATGVLHAALRRWSTKHPGWRLTLMDVAAPWRSHDPERLAAGIAAEGDPFAGLWTEVLDPVLDRERPRTALVSLAYLSQLPATLALAAHLRRRGQPFRVGGSLPRSLAATGAGLDVLRRVLPEIDTDDGSALVGVPPGRVLRRLAWPRILGEAPYLAARPIVPVPLSTGCWWGRCAFCPDRDAPYTPVPLRAVDALLAGRPGGTPPVVHLLDSALPLAPLRRFLDVARDHGAAFYGFARPERRLLRDGLVEAMAGAGCLMLQLGVEGGDADVLARYAKGFDPGEALELTRAAAAAGIRTYLYLLFGLPAERPESREATRRMVAENADAIDFLNLSLFNLPHTGALAAEARAHGVGGRDVRSEARRFLDRRFRPDPAIRPILQRTPRWFRAAHLALMRVEGRREP